MNHPLTIRRAWWRLLRLIGMNKLSWDKQFKAGVWWHLPRSADMLSLVAGLCRGGRIIEFGCGEGSLPFLLPSGSYASYLGYDISGLAIRRAQRHASAAGAANVRFAQCDMAQWDGNQSAFLVVLEECLYYLSPDDCAAFLARCSRCLEADGSMLVIVHSATKHQKTLSVCRRVCQVRDEIQLGGRTYLTLDPRPPHPAATPRHHSMAQSNDR